MFCLFYLIDEHTACGDDSHTVTTTLLHHLRDVLGEQWSCTPSTILRHAMPYQHHKLSSQKGLKRHQYLPRTQLQAYT